MNGERAPLTGGRKLAVLALPWLFLGLFAFMFLTFLAPRIREGHALAVCVGVFALLVFGSFLVAAVTFSRDVLAGRDVIHG
jgi:hypothetical protein